MDERECVTINEDVVVEDTTGPALDRTAVGQRQGGFALHKGIRSGGAVTDTEIVPPVLGVAAQKQCLLTKGEGLKILSRRGSPVRIRPAAPKLTPINNRILTTRTLEQENYKTQDIAKKTEQCILARAYIPLCSLSLPLVQK